MPTITVSILNQSTVVSDTDAARIVAALQVQVHRDFAPAWGIDANLVYVGKKAPAPGTWWLVILDDADQAGALGYHDLTTDGLPIGKVFARTDLQYGSKVSVTASHELLEMLVDPDINLTVLIDGTRGRERLYAYEVCDACESDVLGYSIDGVTVSDFITPAWFIPGSTEKVDFCDRLAGPLQLSPGGYIGVLNFTTHAHWVQLDGRDAEHRMANAAPHGSRRERRRAGRAAWRASTVAFA